MVPHGHYEWNVMPFGLNNAPSEYHNRMDEVYKFISEFCLIYIDDALIFSNSEEEHVEHLSQFKALTYKHRLALSEPKMKIGLDEIDFLGLHIKQGFIIPQPHIAEKISQFPDQLSTRKQIQQFLGIINYAADHVQDLSKMTSQISKQRKVTSLRRLRDLQILNWTPRLDA